jgi:hypothetical protein
MRRVRRDGMFATSFRRTKKGPDVQLRKECAGVASKSYETHGPDNV